MSKFLTILGWTLCLASFVGVFCINLITDKLLPNVSPYKVLVFFCVFFLLNINLNKTMQIISPKNVRNTVQKKYGMTFVFCVGSAIVLMITGIILRTPDVTKFGINRPLKGQVGHTVPYLVQPGDFIEMTVSSPSRRLAKYSLNGLWTAYGVKVKVTDPVTKKEYSIDDAASIPFEETWEDIYSQGATYFQPGQNATTDTKLKHKYFYPWIRFTVPQDSDLMGKDLIVNVRMTINYPYLLNSLNYDIETLDINTDIPLKVSSPEEIATLNKYRLTVKRVELAKKTCLYAVITLGVMAGMLGLMIKF